MWITCIKVSLSENETSFCLLWIPKIFITHLTSKCTENDPSCGVLWSTHQRLVIIKPSLKQTVFSFCSVKVGFKYCELLLGRAENNTLWFYFRKLWEMQLETEFLSLMCIFFILFFLQINNKLDFFSFGGRAAQTALTKYLSKRIHITEAAARICHILMSVQSRSTNHHLVSCNNFVTFFS